MGIAIGYGDRAHGRPDRGGAMRLVPTILAMFAAAWSASGLAAARVERPHYTAELVAESAQPEAGKPVAMAIHIIPQKGWHIYWANPGGSGYAPTVQWGAPDGFHAGPLRHPVPVQLTLGGIVSNVHEGDTVLLQDLTLPAGLPVGQAVPLKADVDLLICSEGNCVPDPVSLDTSVAIGNGQADAAHAALFRQARSTLPQAVAGQAQYMIGDGLVRIFVPGVSLGEGMKLRFFSEQEGVLKAGADQKAEAADGGVLLSIPAGDVVADGKLAGVLRVDAPGAPALGFSVSASLGQSLPAAAGNGLFGFFNSGFLIAMLSAILGGLILNLMPCVFPILSLKALALVKYGGDEREARIEAIGYSIGAVGAVLALGSVLLLLRSGGSAMGWAFQLQDPRVVGVLLLLVVAIATNLAGLFELPALSVSTSQNSGLWGAMGTGALAAFIATPCTGPFMAGALGAAMVLSTPAALAIIAGLGIGMALPFFCLGFFKPLRRWMPRPGNWMVTLRRLLSLPMFATALGLAWIIGRQGGVSAMALALAASLLLGVGLWWYGLRQHAGKNGFPTFVPAAAAIALVAAGISVTPGSARAETAGELGSQPFSQKQLASLTGQNKPVFLYLTADWCLTCKVNEATSLSSAEVATAFAKHGVTVLKGDWTRQDPEIGQFLKARGRAGVPLYLWYAPNGDVVELPQVLTPEMLVDLAGKV